MIINLHTQKLCIRDLTYSGIIMLTVTESNVKRKFNYVCFHLSKLFLLSFTKQYIVS